MPTALASCRLCVFGIAGAFKHSLLGWLGRPGQGAVALFGSTQFIRWMLSLIVAGWCGGSKRGIDTFGLGSDKHVSGGVSCQALGRRVGGMAEWLKAVLLKSTNGLNPRSWVRIPLPPLDKAGHGRHWPANSQIAGNLPLLPPPPGTRVLPRPPPSVPVRTVFRTATRHLLARRPRPVATPPS
jgi:hypothetical protein